MITRDQLQRFAPRPSGSKAEIWDSYADALVSHGAALCAEFGVDEPLELQHFMAQIGHESGGFSILWEDMSYSSPRIMEIFGVGKHSAAVTRAEAYRLAGDPPALAERVYGLGNPRKARELGNYAPGDGYRYRGFGPMQTTGRRDHEKLLGGQTTPYAALRAAFMEWDEKGCNALARADDVKSITKKINGGYNGLDDRKARLVKAKRIWRKLPGQTTRPPPETMVGSTTGNSAIALGTGGTVNTAAEVSTAMAKVAQSGNGFSIGEFVLALAQSPTFWVGLITIGLSAYIWLERRRKLIFHGV